LFLSASLTAAWLPKPDLHSSLYLYRLQPLESFHPRRAYCRRHRTPLLGSPRCRFRPDPATRSGLHLPHGAWPPSRPKSADMERPVVAPGQSRDTATQRLCACPRVQSACRDVVYFPAAAETRTPVSLHHTSCPEPQTTVPHQGRRGRASTQNPVSRWHHPSRDAPPGIPPTPSGARPASPAPSHSLPWCARGIPSHHQDLVLGGRVVGETHCPYRGGGGCAD